MGNSRFFSFNSHDLKKLSYDDKNDEASLMWSHSIIQVGTCTFVLQYGSGGVGSCFWLKRSEVRIQSMIILKNTVEQDA